MSLSGVGLSGMGLGEQTNIVFKPDLLKPVGGHTGKKGGVYFYKTRDGEASVRKDGYFDGSALDDNTVILGIQETQNTPILDLYFVNKTSGDIEVTPKSL